MSRSKNIGIFLIIAVVFVAICCVCAMCSLSVAFAGNIAEWMDIEALFPVDENAEANADEWAEELEIPTMIPEDELFDDENGPHSLGDAQDETDSGLDDQSIENQPAESVSPEAIEDAYQTLAALEEVVVPLADPEDIAFRLLRIENIPDVIETAPIQYKIGDKKTFWLSNLDSNESFQTECELAYITDHAYFWIEPGVSYNQNDLERLAETFESDIYPTNREFFGSEWRPGIDQDEHLYIVYARDLGYSIAGYFSSTDSVHPLANEYSNAHETFMLNADTIGFNESFTYGVLAHEFQHMIHWYQDMNETTWLNEGFSELAALLNGYYDSGFDQLYLWDTDLQLNDWPNDGDTTPHYGAAFLFVTYFMDRFGSEATQALVADPQNGMPSVDNVLEMFGATDASTGEPIQADDFFRDWTVTNLIDLSSAEDGRYTYTSLPDFIGTYDYETITDCANTSYTGQVQQYGVDYYELSCAGEVTLNFEGEQFADLLPMGANSGDFAFWSNKGDHSDMTLTRQFDLSEVPASEKAILEYRLWFDIETDWDYVYVLTSTDGEYWDFYETPSGTGSNPIGNNYGWGYTGVTGGWVTEQLDLSSFIGQTVWVRFEYITDAAVNGEGLLIDDMTLDAVGYFTDFEMDEGGWDAKGFVRTRNLLPQTYLVTLVMYDNDDQVRVEKVDLSEENRASVVLDFTDIDKVYIVISGTTRHTRTPAPYLIELQ
ncbi:MAG: hypothetical protein V2J07_05395 [Anaerolineae bacterium]|jgi:hypothetical protein|nr:hypothetical protein [Anaerolineae bacterium]